MVLAFLRYRYRRKKSLADEVRDLSAAEVAQ
jgi:hypothetical protein